MSKKNLTILLFSLSAIHLNPCHAVENTTGSEDNYKRTLLNSQGFGECDQVVTSSHQDNPGSDTEIQEKPTHRFWSAPYQLGAVAILAALYATLETPAKLGLPAGALAIGLIYKLLTNDPKPNNPTMDSLSDGKNREINLENPQREIARIKEALIINEQKRIEVLNQKQSIENKLQHSADSKSNQLLQGSLNELIKKEEDIGRNARNLQAQIKALLEQELNLQSPDWEIKIGGGTYDQPSVKMKRRSSKQSPKT